MPMLVSLGLGGFGWLVCVWAAYCLHRRFVRGMAPLDWTRGDRRICLLMAAVSGPLGILMGALGLALRWLFEAHDGDRPAR